MLALPLDFANARAPLTAVGLAAGGGLAALALIFVLLLCLTGQRQKQYRRKCCKQNTMKESWHGSPSRQIVTRPGKGSSFPQPEGNFCVCFGFCYFEERGERR